MSDAPDADTDPRHAHPSRYAPQGEHPATQEALAVYLAAREGGATKRDAAEQAGLTVRTINRYLHHHRAFAEAEEAATSAYCRTVVAATRDRLLGGVDEALTVLRDVMNDDTAPPAARVAAAREWLDRAGVEPAKRVDVTSGGKPLAASTDPVAVANAAMALLEARRNGQ